MFTRQRSPGFKNLSYKKEYVVTITMWRSALSVCHTSSFQRYGMPPSPYINQFLSADTIVPGYGNPQNLNRYSYVLNNPLLYTDPTGHMACSDAYEFCGQMTFDGNVTVSILRRALRKYNVKLKGNWDIKHAAAVYHSVGTVGAKFASERGDGKSASEAFRAVYDHITIKWEGGAGMCGNVAAAGGGCTDGAHQIRFWSMSGQTQNDLPRMVKNVIHELGHAYDWT